MFQLKKAVAISVLFRLTGALPGPLSNIAASLQGRDLPAGVPDCSTNDPSFSSATSKWLAMDGQGYYRLRLDADMRTCQSQPTAELHHVWLVSIGNHLYQRQGRRW